MPLWHWSTRCLLWPSILLIFAVLMAAGHPAKYSSSANPAQIKTVVVDGERVFNARRIPKLSRADKRRLILEQFQREGLLPPAKLLDSDWTLGRRGRQMRQKKRRALAGANSVRQPWRIQYHVQRKYRPKLKRSQLRANNTGACPAKLDAVTEGKPLGLYKWFAAKAAFNKRLYVFAGDLVYEVWRDAQGLQQRQAYPISELFPDGPRRVTAALSNQKSGVTLLLDGRQVYRYRWNRRHKRFYIGRKSPKELPSQVDFMPSVGFTWNDGRLILANKDKFVTYDPFWNLATYSSNEVVKYFPNLAINRLVGVARHVQSSMLWMSADGRLQLYDLEKHQLGLELPLNLPKLLACLQPTNNTSALAKSRNG